MSEQRATYRELLAKYRADPRSLSEHEENQLLRLDSELKPPPHQLTDGDRYDLAVGRLDELIETTNALLAAIKAHKTEVCDG